MIEVILQESDGSVVAHLDSDCPEGAILGARTVFDEAVEAQGVYAYGRSLSVLFLVDGNLIRTVKGRP